MEEDRLLLDEVREFSDYEKRQRGGLENRKNDPKKEFAPNHFRSPV